MIIFIHTPINKYKNTGTRAGLSTPPPPLLARCNGERETFIMREWRTTKIMISAIAVGLVCCDADIMFKLKNEKTDGRRHGIAE